MVLNKKYADFIKREIYINRYNKKLSNDIFKFSQNLDIPLIDFLNKEIQKIESRGYDSDFSKKHLKIKKDLKKEIQLIVKNQVNELNTMLKKELTGLIDNEIEFQKQAIEGLNNDLKLTIKPSKAQLSKIITSQPFQGKLLKDYVKDWSDSKSKRIWSTIQTGFINGDSTSQIVKSIKGTKSLNNQDGTLFTSNRFLKTLTRTSITHVTSRASSEYYSQNTDVIEKIQFVAVLDSRTSTICASLDGKLFEPGNEPKTPLHMNCRSRGIPKIKNVPAFKKQSYASWLREQDSEFIDDVLGTTKGKLFRGKKLTLDKFVDNSGKEYTLDDLKRKYPNKTKGYIN